MNPNNPLFRFKYCPLCGSRHFDIHTEKSRQCADCGFTYFTNPAGSTAAVIVNDLDEMLVGIRTKEPALGTYDLVGGFSDLDETIEQTMIREIKEESGLEIQEHQLHYLFSQPNTYPFSGICVKTIDIFFEIKLVGHPALKGMDDISQLRWVPISQIDPADFGLRSISIGVERYLKMQQ